MRTRIAALSACAITATVGAATISPEAAPVLDRFLSWYGSAPGMSTVVTQKMENPGMPPMTAKTHVAILKPNLFKLRTSTEGGGDVPMALPNIEVISNGKAMVQAMPELTSWSESAAPADLAVANQSLTIGSEAGPASLVFDLASPNARQQILDELESVEYAGKEGDHDLLRLMSKKDPQGMMPQIPMTLTVGPKDAAWITKLAIKVPAEYAMQGMPEEWVIHFTEWKKLADTPEVRTSFNWTPPSNWTRVDNLMETLMGGMGNMPPESGAPESHHPMIGKPAPNFTLASMDGTDVSLESLSGKIIILDFWATWCGPCRQGLPVLMEIADKRSSDGVVLWAIDIDEPKDTIAAFLEQKKWNLPVLLDSKGRVAAQYKVGGIPHTVVIDPEGTVRSVEIGFGGADMTRQQLNTLIDEILKPATAPAG